MSDEPNDIGAHADDGRRAVLAALRADAMAMAKFDRIGHPNFEPLARELAVYDRHTTVASIAGLLTVPAYQTASLRLELLLHLAVCHCRGTRRITKRALMRWVNEILAALPIGRMEDPVEDVFVSNVVAGSGNCRIFEGTWEQNDFHLQLLLDVLYLAPQWRGDWKLRARIEGLLALSEAMAARAGIARWATTNDEVPRSDVLRRLPELAALQRRVTFTEGELQQLGVLPVAIAPFMADPSVSRDLPSQTVRHNPLLRHPLARFGRDIVVVLPTAISMAARHAIIEAAAETGRLAELQRDVDGHQGDMLFGRLMNRLELPSGYQSPHPVTLPKAELSTAVAGAAFVPFDVDKIAHVVLLTDDLVDVQRTGVAADVELAETWENELGAYVVAGAKLIREAGTTGVTLLVSGGVGRGMSFSLPRADALPAEWSMLPFSLGDLETFAATEDASLLRLWKLKRQEAAARAAGIAVVNTSGSLNLYASWMQRDFELVADEMPVPQQRGLMMIQGDFLYELRVATRRLVDIHAIPVGSGGAQLRVRRLHEWPFFASASHRPIYVADDLLVAGDLAGVVESEDLVVWLFSRRPHAPSARDTVYRTWDAILSWLDRLFLSLRRIVSERFGRSYAERRRTAGPASQFVCRFRLTLEDEEGWASESIPAVPKPVARPWVSPSTDEIDGEAMIHLPVGFQSLLNQPTNAGERALLEEVAFEIVASVTHARSAPTGVDRESLRAEVVEAVATCMGGPDAREMHVWHTNQPLDLIDASGLGAPRFVQPEDEAAWQFGLGARLGVTSGDQPHRDKTNRDGPRGAAVVEGALESISFLHRLVDHVWEELRTRLQVIDGPALVDMLARNVEAVFKDRDHWRRTARAVSAIRASEDVPAISMRRESERAVATTVARVVMEMALCTSPSSGGRQPSLADIDWLVAGVALLIDAAADADAIRGGLAPSSVGIAANGRVRTERDELETLIRRYGRDVHADEFRVAADAYEELFRNGAEEIAAEGAADNSDLSPRWDERFRRAYAAEFGISFDRVIDAFAELIDLAGEHGRVVVTTRGTVAERLRAKRGLSAPEIDALFSALALQPRPRWDRAPAGFTNRDWEPWRFRRRLSVSARPLIVFGNSEEAKCIYGVAQLGASLTYVSEGIRSGWFPTEYFQSDEMRRYRGAITNELGLAFEREVASLCSGAGWTNMHSVQMSALGAPAGLRLGEVDVIAWRPGHPVLWLIECKRLQPTRTISEIVERLRQFRGESGDLLAKHLRRLEWIRAHLDTLRMKLAVPHDVGEVHAILVTSTRMPMQYAEDLPLPPGHVVSADDLLPVLERRPV